MPTTDERLAALESEQQAIAARQAKLIERVRDITQTLLGMASNGLIQGASLLKPLCDRADDDDTP